MKTYQAMIQVSYWVQVEAEAMTKEQAKDLLEAKAWSEHLKAGGEVTVFDLEEVEVCGLEELK